MGPDGAHVQEVLADAWERWARRCDELTDEEKACDSDARAVIEHLVDAAPPTESRLHFTADRQETSRRE